MKCKYAKCFCQDSDEIIKSYHPECLKTKNDINEIKELFVNNINKNVVYAQLIRVINTIIFNKGVTADYLKFGLQYYISHKIPLNYPQGLYYVIQNKDVASAYNRKKSAVVKQEMSSLSDGVLDIDKTFEHKTFKKKTIGDLFDE